MLCEKKGDLRNFAKFTGKYLCQSLFFNKGACNFIKKEALAQEFSVKFAKFLSTLFFTEHLWAPASVIIKLFSLHRSWENSLRNQVWTIQKWSKILCEEIRKFWMPQKIIIATEKLFNYCTHRWRGFAEVVLQVVLLTILWFTWSVKKHSIAKIFLAIREIFLHENNCYYNSFIFSEADLGLLQHPRWISLW